MAELILELEELVQRSLQEKYQASLIRVIDCSLLHVRNFAMQFPEYGMDTCISDGISTLSSYIIKRNLSATGRV